MLIFYILLATVTGAVIWATEHVDRPRRRQLRLEQAAATSAR